MTTHHAPQTARHAPPPDDLIMMGAGVLTAFFSLLPWVGLAGFTANAWSMGLTAWPPVLLSIAVSGALAVQSLGWQKLPPLGAFGPRLLLGLVSVFAATWLLVRTITLVLESGSGGSTAAGLWLTLITVLAQAVSAYRAFRISGEPLPAPTGTRTHAR